MVRIGRSGLIASCSCDGELRMLAVLFLESVLHIWEIIESFSLLALVPEQIWTESSVDGCRLLLPSDRALDVETLPRPSYLSQHQSLDDS
jgi:hypothetical protein